MNPYYVISPEYQTYGSYDPPEAPEYGCDCVEVEAHSKKEALRIAVKLLLKRNGSWADSNRQSNLCPYSGYRVEVARCGHGYPHFVMVDGKAIHQRCWGCEAQDTEWDAETWRRETAA